MIEYYDIVESLLDNDGSCRDLNFELPTWAGVKKLLALLETDYKEISGTDQEGKALPQPFRESVLIAAKNSGYAHLLFSKGVGLIRNLQVFICMEKNGTPFVEISFFPDDVCSTSTLRDDFITWTQEMQSRLEARRHYARYENASWQFGDVSSQSGVFMASNNIS